MKKSLIFTVTILLTLFTVACGEGHLDGLEAEACAHMNDDLSTAITAADGEAEATDTSPSDWLHKRVELTLSPDGSGGFRGFVIYEATAETEYMFFTDSEFTLKINGLEPESANSVSACAEVTSSFAFNLNAGEHLLSISSSTANVSLIAEQVRGDHSDHEH